MEEELNKNAYKNIIQRYSDRQLICELGITKRQEENLYIKKQELNAEIKRRMGV